MYLPCDFERNANLGYAFVNLVSDDSHEARLALGSRVGDAEASLGVVFPSSSSSSSFFSSFSSSSFFSSFSSSSSS